MPARPGRPRWSSRSTSSSASSWGRRALATQHTRPFVRGAAATTPLDLLNQDIVAYAPDNRPCRRWRITRRPESAGFEATPVTTGSHNPLVGGLRGFSVVIYGLQHDLNDSTAPAQSVPVVGAVNGGLPSLTLPGGLNAALQPARRLAAVHSRRFAGAVLHQSGGVSVGRPKRLLSPSATQRSSLALRLSRLLSRSTLLSRLANIKDKLIKALIATGPNSGSTDFQSVLSQLDNYRRAVSRHDVHLVYGLQERAPRAIRSVQVQPDGTHSIHRCPLVGSRRCLRVVSPTGRLGFTRST